MDLDLLLFMIRNGENEKVEFKEKVTRNIHHEIAAMSNSQGGVILLGINDRGEIKGVDHGSIIEIVSSSIQSIIPSPGISFDRIVLNDKNVTVITVKKGDNLCSIGGVVHIRIGSSIRPLCIQEILMLSAELGTFEWDRVPLLEKIEIGKDLEDDFFSAILRARGKRITEDERNRYLRSRGALKDGKLTNAGTLIFTRADQHITQAVIRLVLISRGAPKGELRFVGPVWKAIDEAYDSIIRETGRDEVIVGTTRKKIFRFPPRIIREGLINAVAHRNYSVRADIRIILEEGTLVIKSPGGLLPGVDLEDPEHVPRNPSLCDLLYDMGYIERYGQGMVMMKDEAEKHDDLTLEFRTSSNRFEVRMVSDLITDLDARDREILELAGGDVSSSELSMKIGLSKPAIVTRLNRLVRMDLIRRKGKGPGTRYIRQY
ncbi:MAG: putative DNA binding domain-containing protein [Thermoplasmata archaeon]|nr:putative DNA binding domain-containing protein [Thermoplasmata archaeon]